METILGLFFWGGLLVLASRGVIRSYRGSSSRVSVTPAPPVVPPTGPSAAPPTLEESARESGALVDGLIIGHHLTRTHYEDRLVEQAEAMQSLRDDVADHAYPGGDDLDDVDLDDVDDMGGYRADDVADGSGQLGADGSGSDGSDEFGAGDDPWDDVFGYDEDDDY